MKFRILLIVGLIAIITAYVLPSCSDSNATKAGTESKPFVKDNYSYADVTLLKEAGFTSIESVLNKEADVRKEYYKQFNLNYLSETSLEKLCKENNLHKGPATIYIGHIPEETLAKITDSYTKLKLARSNVNWPLIYTALDGRMFTQDQVDNMIPRDRDWVKSSGINSESTLPVVMVAAPLNQFKYDEEEYYLEKNEIKKGKVIDPIAYVRVYDGYIELARWLN